MNVRNGVKSAKRLPRGAFLFCALLFTLSAASNAGAAEADSGDLPDALYWEVSMPPGYVWMNGCGEMGTKKSGMATIPVIQPPEGVSVDAHAGHHPGKVAAWPIPLDTSSLEITLAELYLLVNGDAKTSPAN